MLTNNNIACFHEQLTEVIRKKFAQQSTVKEADKEILLHFMTAAYVGVIEWWIKHKQPRSPEEMAKQVKLIFKNSPLFPF